jgi:hypothetical protein
MHPCRCRRNHSGRGYPQGLPHRPRWSRQTPWHPEYPDDTGRLRRARGLGEGVRSSGERDIRATLHGFEPHTKAEEQLYSEGLDQVARLGDARRTRLIASEEGVPGILWAVLIFGGIAGVGFTYLFGLESTWAHRLMVVILAAVIGLVLFTIGAMGHPFEGGARIGPGFFELVLERIDTSKLSNLR